jgi:hypothetical protein
MAVKALQLVGRCGSAEVNGQLRELYQVGGAGRGGAGWHHQLGGVASCSGPAAAAACSAMK